MKTTLELIAKELRDLTSRAHGNPATVQVRASTLMDYAEAIEAHLNEPETLAIHTEGAGGGISSVHD